MSPRAFSLYIPAQVAYEAWAKALNIESLPFKNLSRASQRAWLAVANAMIDWVKASG